jgi:hypothetical protein
LGRLVGQLRNPTPPLQKQNLLQEENKMNYESIIKNPVPELHLIVTGTQPKEHNERIPADTTKSECYYCWRTKSARQHKYYVEQGILVRILENGMAEVEIPCLVKNRPDIKVRTTHLLYLDEFGSTPEQAVENKL